MTSLRRIFSSCLNEAQQRFHVHPQLEQELQALLQHARATWPTIPLDDSDYLTYVAEVLCRPENTGQRLADLHTADLYLALACVQGQDKAIALCVSQFEPEIEQALHKMNIQEEMVDEVKQTLRERLFVAPSSSTPQLAVYSGRGRLGGWLRVVAVRQALMMFRTLRRESLLEEDDLAMLAEVHSAEGGGVEQEHMKLLYRTEFKVAFRQAVESLSAQEKDLLRRYFIAGQTIDQLGEAFGVHRATAARWIDKAKRSLITAVRRTMMDQLQLEQETYESVVKLISSQIDVSVRYLFGEAGVTKK